MIKLPDGIVTVHLDDKRYRGAYYFRGDKLVVTAYGMKEQSADMAVLGGERGGKAGAGSAQPAGEPERGEHVQRQQAQG